MATVETREVTGTAGDAILVYGDGVDHEGDSYLVAWLKVDLTAETATWWRNRQPGTQYAAAETCAYADAVRTLKGDLQARSDLDRARRELADLLPALENQI